MEINELDSVTGASTSLISKSIRLLLATAVLGTVTAYGAITVKPELVQYLSFIPDTVPVESNCSEGSCGSACSISECGSSCGSATGSCSTEGLTACPSSASEQEIVAEPSSDSFAEEASAPQQ